MTTQARRTLFGEFMLLVTVIAVPTVLIVGVVVMHTVHELTRQQTLLALETLAEEKAGMINRYIDDHLARVENLAAVPLVAEALPALARAYR
ncbi:MAG: hypothetical protein D6682_04650, partial [Zetaproteobacteria bacterium]